VPTDWFAPDEPVHLPGTGEYVIKPSVGAGSLGAGRFTAADESAARAHVRQLHAAGRTAMVSPYLNGVDSSGERALIYVGGRYSHAVTKAAMLAPGVVHDITATTSHSLFIEERLSAAEPTAAERAVADAVVDEVARRFDGAMLYARVDLLPAGDGPVVLELELVEPSLFLGYADGAASRFADAIADAIVGRA
jgi:glutathione synthase/RimK-type ligase-like ATP-grasp enzyme